MRILALVAEIPGIVFMYGLGKRAWDGVWRINNKNRHCISWKGGGIANPLCHFGGKYMHHTSMAYLEFLNRVSLNL